MLKNIVLTIIFILFAGGLVFLLYNKPGSPGKSPAENPTITKTPINSFAECVLAGNPVMESYPRQCAADGNTFVEDLGNSQEKQDIISVESPLPNSFVSSPLAITGQARGNWYFEASFPVYLYDANGKELGMSVVQADGEWMTTEFVPFSETLNFEKPETKTGELVFKKDNPSGLPENDDQLRFPVIFK